MSSPSAERSVLLVTRDLFFRAKLDGCVAAAGAKVVRAEPADLAVIELAAEVDVERVRELAARGVPVIAFTSHVRVELLRAAREAGATAVPNSEVEATLRACLTADG